MKHIVTSPEQVLADLLADFRSNGAAGITLAGVQLTLTTCRKNLFGDPTGETELRGQGLRNVEVTKGDMRRYARILGMTNCTAPEQQGHYWTMRGTLPAQSQGQQAA